MKVSKEKESHPEVIADRAIEWGICSSPKTRDMNSIIYQVLKAANTVDAEEFNPENFRDEE